MAIKMTAQVKAYAEREFDKKVSALKEKFDKPINERLEKIKRQINDRVLEINEQLLEVRKEFPEMKIEFGTTYNDGNKLVYASTYFKNQEKYVGPDKLKFMAELSTGESLDDLAVMLDRYFAE